jgi:hypothetical protein
MPATTLPAPATSCASVGARSSVRSAGCFGPGGAAVGADRGHPAAWMHRCDLERAANRRPMALHYRKLGDVLALARISSHGRHLPLGPSHAIGESQPRFLTT